MKILNLAAVAAGGAIGASARYIINLALSGTAESFPLGTLAVNIVGSFIMGVVMGAGATSLPEYQKVFLTAGIMGGLTTFSTFSFETVRYFSTGNYLFAALNACLNLALSFAACFVGTVVSGHI
jgi:CrcB protein